MSSNTYTRKTITGTLYEVKNKGGRHRLPDDVRLSEIVKGMTNKSMREKLDLWIAKGWSETLIINLALSEWMDKMNSVQETV